MEQLAQLAAKERDAAVDVISEREREVLTLVAQGLTNKAIAERLVISENTARNHVSRILDKLGLTRRSEAAVEELLELVRRDKKWNAEAARKQLVKIFDALGGTHPLTVSARRHLSSILFS